MLAQVAIDLAPDVADLRIAMPSSAEGPFGRKTVLVPADPFVARWNDLEANIRADRRILSRCRETMAACPRAAKSFLAIVDDGRAHAGRARIGVINRAINMAIVYTSDFVQWGVVDRWSAPLETFSTGRGDCEDYAIAKYVALLEVGLSEDDVKFVSVRDLDFGYHAVVDVRLDGRWIVLDNRWLTLAEDKLMPRTAPQFVFDRDGVKQFLPAKDAAFAAGEPVSVASN